MGDIILNYDKARMLGVQLRFKSSHMLGVAITVMSLIGTKVYANPTTTPRIYSKEIVSEEIIQIQDAITSVTETDKPVGQINLLQFQSELDNKIANLKSASTRTSNIDEQANLYLQIEQIELLKKLISEPSNCDSILNINDVSKTDATKFCVSLNDAGNKSDKEKEYNEIVSKNKSAFTKEFIDMSIDRINSKTHSESKSAIISRLVDFKRSMLIDDEHNILLSKLNLENDRNKRYDLIRDFFNKYDMGLPATDSNPDLNTISGSISYSHELYEHGLKNKLDHWRDDEHFKVNYLKYSENLSANAKNSFGGFVLGSADSNQTIKINALEYDVYLSDKVRVPLTLYTSEIIESEESDEASTNRTKLLDPEMGTINLALSSITKFRAGELCRFSSAYGCYLPLQVGARVLKLPKTDAEGESSDEYKVGGYFKAGLNTVFPIMPRNDPHSIAGRLALSGNYVYYYQGSTDLESLFPEVLNEKGEPALTGNDYSAFNLNAVFSITNKIELSAKYFKGLGSSKQLDSIVTFEFGYSVD